jgi:hypothetical protein
LVILEIGSWFLPRSAWTVILLFCTSCCCWDDRLVLLCTAIGWDGVLWTICLSWPWITILPVSWVTRIETPVPG